MDVNIDEKELSTSQARLKKTEIITQDQAKTVAINFIKLGIKQNVRYLPNVNEISIKEIQTLTNEEDLPILHIINLKDDKGFIIISASTLERPILAYSDKSNFDINTIEDKGGVIDWLYLKYEKINSLIKNNSTSSIETSNQWSAVYPFPEFGMIDRNGNVIIIPTPQIVNEFDTSETYGKLMTTEWDQRLNYVNSPQIIGYNNDVRFNNCSAGTTPAGCVAVAVGQIVKYHTNYLTPYIWNMPNIIDNTNHTTTEAKNIGKFLKQIGTYVNMNYECTKSGAQSEDARNTFVTHYQYTASNLTTANKNTIVNDIKNNKPVYIDGCTDREIKTYKVFGIKLGQKTTYKNCHAWVAEGYQKITRTTEFDNGYTYSSVISDHIYMNWGWGGYRNGFFDFDVWENINGQSFPETNFFYKQNMIYNIKPILQVNL